MTRIGLDLSLFTLNGSYKRPALAYKAMNDLTQDTPLRLATPSMNASNGITYLAGISADKTNISVLISNFNAEDTVYTIKMTNIPWQTTYTTVQYLIDETHHFEIQENTMQNISPYIKTETLKKNTVHFYRFTNTSIVPEEGPEVAKIPWLLRLRFLDPLTKILTILILSSYQLHQLHLWLKKIINHYCSNPVPCTFTFFTVEKHNFYDRIYD